MAGVEYAVAPDGTHIAYRVLDRDPGQTSEHSIVMVTGALIPMGVFDDDAGIVRMLDGLRSIGRVIVFDRRGIGVSDPITDWSRPVIEQWVDDLGAVIDASGAEQTVVFGWDSFGVATRFAAERPGDLERIVVFQPLGGDDEQWRAWIAERTSGWQGPDLLDLLAPSRSRDPSFREWFEQAGRVGASPATAGRIWESMVASSAEKTLHLVTVPTLVLHRPNSGFVPSEAVHTVVDLLPNAIEVAVDGRDTWPFVGDVDAVVSEISEFVVGERRVAPPERLLSAVLFTDLVDSTRRAADVGDATWKAVLDRHDDSVRTAVERGGGRLVKTMGDGVLALFPSAGVAVSAARRVRDELDAHDLRVRIGIHVGDVDLRGDDVSGLAVNIAARVMGKAGTGEVAVTTSVVAAIAGQAVTFESLGTRELKGIPGTWELYRLEDG
jgi:class 3 adenylate cyclase/pimeloyl-ACP methyl ester carboxylesterase